MRRLLLQLLLEPEKVYVHATLAAGQSISFVSGSPALSSVSIGEPRHPAYRHGKKDRLLYVSSEMTCNDLIRLLTGKSSSLLTRLTPSQVTERLSVICVIGSCPN